LPEDLKDIWEKHEGKTVKEIIQMERFLDKITKFRAGRLYFKNDCIEKMFDETLSELVKVIRKGISEAKDKGLEINALLIVGGFAMSTLVMNCLRQTFCKDIPLIVRPVESELAVLMGAVLYGQNESIVASRVMAHTYGVACTMKFDRSVNLESTMFKADGEEWAANVFRVHVSKGQRVQLNEWTQEKDYRPETEKQNSVVVFVFASDKNDPKHTDDGYCIGKFDVDFTRCEPSKRVVMISLRFGSTEVEVRGRVESNGFVYTQKLGLV